MNRMRSRTTRLTVLIGVLSLLIGITLACSQASKANTAEEFYKGKTLTWVVSSTPGSSTDTLSRAVAAYLAKEIGVTARMENTDNQVGLNETYTQANRDGLTFVANPSDGILANDILKGPGVLYETEKFNFIANLNPSLKVLQVSPKLPYKTLKDLQRAEALKGGGTTANGLLSISTAVGFELFGLRGQVITGFKSKNDLVMALARGEVDLIITSDTGGAQDEKDGYASSVLIVGEKRSPAIPNAPTMSELGVTVPKELESVIGFTTSSGTAAALPPEVPEERVQYLRQAFQKLNDIKDLQKEVEKLTGSWSPSVPGEQVQKYMVAMKADKALASQLQGILAKYKTAK